jgi:hypothetical protein
VEELRKVMEIMMKSINLFAQTENLKIKIIVLKLSLHHMIILIILLKSIKRF